MAKGVPCRALVWHCDPLHPFRAVGEWEAWEASSCALCAYHGIFFAQQPYQTAYVGTFATCAAYQAQWNQFAFQPNFTSNFLVGVAELGGSVTWLEFVEAFGTHYATELLLGGSAFYFRCDDHCPMRLYLTVASVPLTHSTWLVCFA